MIQRKIFKISAVGLAVLGLALMIGSSVQAAVKFSTDEATYIRANESIDGAAFLTGKSIRIEGTVNGDVYCAAERLVIEGTVNGDVICAANSALIGGSVNGDVRIVGEDVTVNSTIKGSATLFGSVIAVESAADIAKDVTLGGVDVLVNGSIGRDAIGLGETVTFNGPVGRDVRGEYAQLVIGPAAIIKGSAEYASQVDARIDGTVLGATKRSDSKIFADKSAGSAGVVIIALTAIMWVIATSLVLLLVTPKKSSTATNLQPREVLLVSAIGLIALITAPFVIAILFASLVGIPLAVTLLLLWGTILMISAGLTAIYFGRVVNKVQPQIERIPATMLAGIVIVVLLFMPYVNVLAWLFILSFGSGAVIYAIRGEYDRPIKKVTQPKVRLVKEN